MSSSVEGADNVRLVHVMTAPASLLVFLRGQTGYMQARGFEVSGVAAPGAALQQFAERDHVPVYAVDMRRRIAPHHDVVAIVQLLRVLREIKPHIVHAGTPKGGLIGMIAATIARVPVRIYHIRGLPTMGRTGWQYHLYRATERIACALADRVLCVSHSVRAEVIAEGLCPADKIVTFGSGSGNGVDAIVRFNPDRLSAETRAATRSKLGFPDDALIVGFVGRLIRRKGVVELATAWQRTRSAHPGARLLIVGGTEQHDPVPESTLRSLRADPSVHFAGEVADVAPLLAVMDVFVLPTFFHEGFPNVLLEAAAMELPVIATRVAGCIDAVQEGVTGTLVPPCDADALARAIAHYLADPPLRRQHGHAGRERVLREFRPEAIWQALYDEYIRLLTKKGMCVPDPVQRQGPNTIAVRSGEKRAQDSNQPVRQAEGAYKHLL